MTSLIDHKHALLLAHAGLAGGASGPDPAPEAGAGAGPGSVAGATLIMALLRTSALIDRACAAELSAFDLTEGRLSVLLAIDARGPDATPARIADELGISRAAVTGLIDGLARQELVARQASSTDRRSTSVALTEAGRDALDRIGPVYGSWLRELAAGVSPDAARGTIAALTAVQGALRIGSGEPGNG